MCICIIVNITTTPIALHSLRSYVRHLSDSFANLQRASASPGRLQLHAAMSAERWSSSLAELYAFGNPFLALLGSGSTAHLLLLQKPEKEQPVPQLEPDTKFEVLSTFPPDEQPVPQLDPDTEDSELEWYRGGEPAGAECGRAGRGRVGRG